MDAGSHVPGASAPPVLLPKHVIFLSHSGQEKAFVQELNQALLLVDHSPFFDQNEDSLPIGERFPDLIFRAAQQCRVAVIVLSEGYLTTKWPMVELVEFHKSMKGGNPLKLLPVFYKLKPDEIEKSEWKGKWVDLFKQDEELVEKCKDAVHALKAINGLIFEGNDHIKYKEDVVREICKLWPPSPPFDTSDMQGCDRLCQLMSELFKEDNGIHYLGIYGVSGSGKSKHCEAMCNYYFEEYAGKYCIVDLEDNKTTENQAKNKRELRKYLKDVVPNGAFLVVENVSQCSIKEAEFYLRAGYARGSRVLVTSRNRSILEKLFGGPQYSDFCQPVPALNDIEAVQLVLAKGAPGRSITYLNDLEYNMVSYCCANSCFDEQYHPSFLIAVASYFERTVDRHEIANWGFETSMGVVDMLRDVFRDVFRHVLLEYDNNLSRTARLIFLDLALHYECKLTTCMDLHPSWQGPEFINSVKSATNYISCVHGLNGEHAERKVKELQEMSFLRESAAEVGVSDFYREFAWWLINNDDRDESNWYRIWSENQEAYGRLCVPVNWPETATRVIMVDISEYMYQSVQFQKLTKLVYLELVRVEKLHELNLQGLSSLRVMKVKQCKDLKKIFCRCSPWWKPNCYLLSDSGCLGELRVVQLEDLPNLESVSFAPHCSSLISSWIYDCPKAIDLFYFRHSKCLTQLVISSGCGEDVKPNEFFVSMIQDMMELKILRVLAIGDVIPASIESINVSKLVHLIILDLSGAKMTRIEELCELRHLAALGLYGCSELSELPNLAMFTALEYLCISHCYKLAKTFAEEEVPHGVENYHALGDKCNLDDHEVKFLEETLSTLQWDGHNFERKVHQMMRRLSVAADEDIQHTLSFFEKTSARRDGLALLPSANFGTARLIEGFPHIFLRDLDTELRPVLTFLETVGVPNESMGKVLLLFPSVLMCNADKELQPRLRALKKVGVRARDLGRMIVRYPWLLSRTTDNNVNEFVDFLISIKVPKGDVDRSITKCPQLLGCSTVRTLQPMVERMNELGVKSKRLGYVIAASPQLLVRSVDEFNEVVNFLLRIGVEEKDLGAMLKRHPGIFACDVDTVLEPKVNFLREIGMQEEVLCRVLRFFPEMLTMKIEESLRPRVKYLQDLRFKDEAICCMITRFPSLLSYNPETVMKPKLEFLSKSMGRRVYEVVEYPRYFSYSLEKKIKPRAQVIQRRKVECSLKEMLALNDEQFAAKYLGVGGMLVPPR